jgi:ketosteroid isomerase-like protein
MLKAAVPIFALAALTIYPATLVAHEPSARKAAPVSIPASARGAAAIVDAFHAALRRGDTQAAAALLTDDAFIFESGAVERSKAEYAGHHLAADAAFAKEMSSAVTRRSGRSGDGLAWIASEGRTTGIYKAKTLDLVTTETMILRRTGGAWKIVHVHWSSAVQR